MGDTLQFLVRHGYLVLFASVLAQQIGLPLPSTPFVVGNHNFPSRAFQPLGLATPLHCTLNIPSPLPYEAHGMFLISGPTGSGKTTTLYALLQTFSGSVKKVLSVEDPVEYHFEHVTQTQVAPQIGLTFASALRSFLRQDPDVILVGEIRDAETASVAVQAAMTGHLLLASVHANDAHVHANGNVDVHANGNGNGNGNGANGNGSGRARSPADRAPDPSHRADPPERRGTRRPVPRVEHTGTTNRARVATDGGMPWIAHNRRS